jgi:hypothetical protein
VRDVAEAIAGDDPLALLGLVSSLLAVLDPRRRNPFDPAPETPSREELVQSFLAVELPETSALLAAIAELSGDTVLRHRVRREVAARGHVLPRWLADLHRTEPAGPVFEIVHALGDGDNIVIGAQLPGGYRLTAVVYIDHNMGTVAKDGFVVAGPADELVERMLDIAADPDVTARELDPADARARIAAAIEAGASSYPPFENETWPACRPLVEWAAALQPSGGSGYRRPQWDADAVARLAERFFASPFAAGLDDADHRGLLDSLLWFGTDYGPGDPMRWSPTAVQILLADWLPRKLVAEAPYLAKAPDLLRAFIRFCHAERGIRAELTARTLDAVDQQEADYQRVIRAPRPQGPAALLAAIGALGNNGWLEAARMDTAAIMLDGLRLAVGGQDALDRLDTAPLPDEPFDWGVIPADIHDRVAEVLALVEHCCEKLLDPEYRTACRRFLSRAAAVDPEIFRRRGQPVTAAAAVCWAVGKANDLFEPRTGGLHLQVKDLVRHFGIRGPSLSQRAMPMLRALGAPPSGPGGVHLGSPDYLTAARRAKIINLRDHYASIIR